MTDPLEKVARGAAAGIADSLASEPLTDAVEDAKEKAYRDRNLVALALARSHLPHSGYYYEEESPDWPVVWVELPSPGDDDRLQVSWHLHPDLESLVEDGLMEQEPPDGWDGHSREEKNDRLIDYVQPDGSTS